MKYLKEFKKSISEYSNLEDEEKKLLKALVNHKIETISDEIKKEISKKETKKILDLQNIEDKKKSINENFKLDIEKIKYKIIAKYIKECADKNSIELNN